MAPKAGLDAVGDADHDAVTRELVRVLVSHACSDDLAGGVQASAAAPAGRWAKPRQA